VAGWWLDEAAWAGAEHLDDAYVAGYEAKAGYDPRVTLRRCNDSGSDARRWSSTWRRGPASSPPPPRRGAEKS
jgi:hypothetical protein